ncbi:MAG: glycosyltransferase family 2 protein [bacterium]
METAFSIIIPTWNNLPFLKLCVESILKNSAAQHQIIIHVNEGIDGTLKWVRKQGFDYTYSEQNVGVCIACNMMRSKVKTDYIFYLNDDMYVLPGWDTALAAEVASLPDNRFFLSSTMIQPRHRLGGVIQAYYGDSVENFEEERLLKEYMTHQLSDWSGATLPPNLLHRDTWDLVGGYSVEFTPGMGSDPDLTAKLWFVGVRYLKGISASRVYHFETKSTGRVHQNDDREQLLLKWGVSNSVIREHIARQGAPWTGPHEAESISPLLRLRYRLKTAFNILTGKQLGPIDRL